MTSQPAPTVTAGATAAMAGDLTAMEGEASKDAELLVLRHETRCAAR